MLMKYKDFKTLSEKDMKHIVGGYVQDCRASAKCKSGSIVSCNGQSGTWAGGQILGCSGVDANTQGTGGMDGLVSCYHQDSTTGAWSSTTKNCTSSSVS